MIDIKFTDDKQQSEFGEILDYIQKNYVADLQKWDVTRIYKDIYSPEGKFMPDSQGQSIDLLGKLSEFFLKVFPNFLEQFNGIEMCMFQGADLAELNIPKNIKYFGQGAFIGARIGKINYEGTEAEWNKIKKPYNWNILCDPQHLGGDNKAVETTLEKVVPINCADRENIYNIEKVDLEDDEPDDLDEAMNEPEVNFKNNVLNYLAKDGFPTYASYLDKFHFNFVTSNDVGRDFVAGIVPNRGVVLINPNLDESLVSLVLRHETAHQVFKHLEHMFAKLKEMGIDNPSELAYQLANIVGDYHISNYIYDEIDAQLAKHIKIENLKEVAGLVTELDFPENPEYWKMDFDQLWDIFVKNYNPEDLGVKPPEEKEDEEEQEEEQQESETTDDEIESDDDDDDDKDRPEQKMSDGYVEGWNALLDAYYKHEITRDQVREWVDSQGGIGAIIYRNMFGQM